MNHTVYLFGDLGSGYTQFPDDYTKQFIQVQSTGLESITQIVLHREGNLVFYTYYRKFLSKGNQGCHIGFSVCFNSVYCTDINELFRIFENSITEMAITGNIIEYSNDGDIIASTNTLYLQTKEIDRLTSSIGVSIDNLPVESFYALPPLNYGGDKNSKHICLIEKAEEQIPILLKEVDTLVFLKDKKYNTRAFSGYARKLSDLSAKKEELEKENARLVEQNNALNRKKKQYRLVFSLTAILLLAIVFLFSLRKDIDTLKGDVEQKEASIVTKNVRIDSLNKTITNLNNDVSSLKREINDRDNTIRETNSFIDRLSSTMVCPFSISEIEVKNGEDEYGETIYSSNTTYIYSRMTASSLVGGSYDIYVKFFSPNGLSTGMNQDVPTGFSYKSTVTLQKNGTTTIYVSGWGNSTKGNWKSGAYRIEYWYNDVKLGTKYFTIY